MGEAVYISSYFWVYMAPRPVFVKFPPAVKLRFGRAPQKAHSREVAVIGGFIHAHESETKACLDAPKLKVVADVDALLLLV